MASSAVGRGVAFVPFDLIKRAGASSASRAHSKPAAPCAMSTRLINILIIVVDDDDDTVLANTHSAVSD